MAARHLLSLHSVSLAFGGPAVLGAVSLNVAAGDRACITGRNGEGKSTLLRVIAGLLEPDTGEIIRAPNLKVAFLEQDVPGDRPGTVREVAGPGSDSFMSQLGLKPDAAFDTLSGGLRRRVLLARTLAARPDLVLLDEPTNHLDIASIEWLESYIRRQSATAFFFVTHDRAFLRDVAAQVYDLDRGRLAGWNCDYATFVQRKADLLADEAAMWEKKSKKLAVEEVWIRQGVKARTTRNQGRVEALLKLRLEFAARRTSAGQTNLKIDTAAASGDRVIKIEDLSFTYPGADHSVIEHFTADILRGERIGLIGSNGMGKTTLLNLLCGRLAPTSGKVTLGTRVRLAFFDQLRAALDPEETVVQSIAADRDMVSVGGVTKHVYAYLADFLFTPERARTPVHALSGGEKARLLLAKLFLDPANLLVMDEPTNDLDVETLELLEEQLLAYRGTLLLVSHDRVFLDHVVTSTFVFEGGANVGVFPGGYADWVQQRKSRSLATPQGHVKPSAHAPGESASSAKSALPRRLSYNEKRELASLPDRIDAREREVREIESALADPGFYAKDSKKAVALGQRLPLAKNELEKAFNRWAALSEDVAR